MSATGRTAVNWAKIQIQHTSLPGPGPQAVTCGLCDSQMYPALQSLARDPLVQDYKATAVQLSTCRLAWRNHGCGRPAEAWGWGMGGIPS